MSERIDTVVVGAGQAGLATSHHLTQLGVEHVVLERGRVGETWRSERWDGFYLNTPNWTLQLPGGEYAGDRPDDFMPLDAMIGYIEGYAAAVRAPVREQVGVERLRPRPGGFTLRPPPARSTRSASSSQPEHSSNRRRRPPGPAFPPTSSSCTRAATAAPSRSPTAPS